MQLGELLEIGRVLGDDAAVGGAGHRRQQRGEPAYRPNTSMTRKRSCDPADVRRRCVSSMVRVTHVLKPMQ